MKDNLIKDIVQGMLPYLNNAQNKKLQEMLQYTLVKYEVTKVQDKIKETEQNFIELFLSAKRIEGCSEKSLKYYQATIETMVNDLQKEVKYIVTDDIRRYLTEYQQKKNSSKVTIDNIRRILSSFFSWLEDEDYILKSPVRRIHKVKTGINIKETYSDEMLELMRDNCTELRDLAMIDMLASTGMRVGEMVLLNRNDIDFNERECIVFGKGNKERIVPISPELSKVLKIYHLEYRKPTAEAERYFFVSSKGKKITEKFVYLMVTSYLSQVSLKEKKSPHILRHSFATHVLNGGAEISKVKKIMGHASLASTQVYTNANIEQLKKVFRAAHPRGNKKD